VTKQKTVILDVLNVLYDIRAEVHGDVEDSVINQLDDAISQLEIELCDDSQEFNALDALTTLGKAVELIPAIRALLELIRQAG